MKQIITVVLSQHPVTIKLYEINHYCGPVSAPSDNKISQNEWSLVFYWWFIDDEVPKMITADWSCFLKNHQHIKPATKSCCSVCMICGHATAAASLSDLSKTSSTTKHLVPPTTKHLSHILVKLRQVGHEVHSQAVVSGLCGVDLVPEDMVVGVGTNVVIVAASEGAQEGWPHVTRAGSVSEALLYRHIHLLRQD